MFLVAGSGACMKPYNGAERFSDVTIFQEKQVQGLTGIWKTWSGILDVTLIQNRRGSHRMWQLEVCGEGFDSMYY